MLKIYNSSNTAGVTISPAPTSLKVNVADMDNENSTRSAAGLMSRTRIRRRVRTIELEWKYLTRAEMATIIAYFNSDTAFTLATGNSATTMEVIYDANGKVTSANGNKDMTTTSVPRYFLALEYPDPYTSGNQRRIFYVSDRSTPLYNLTLGRWEGLSLSLIEM